MPVFPFEPTAWGDLIRINDCCAGLPEYIGNGRLSGRNAPCQSSDNQDILLMFFTKWIVIFFKLSSTSTICLAIILSKFFFFEKINKKTETILCYFNKITKDKNSIDLLIGKV